MFEYLIEDFKTYKPLLSGIKNEYEMMLAYQRQVIRELEPLKVHNLFWFFITYQKNSCFILKFKNLELIILNPLFDKYR